VAQESAEGIVGQAVGKASEALQSRKAEQQIGRAGNDGRRPERLGVASRTGDLMSGKRQKIQYALALEPVGQGETPVKRLPGTEPFVAKPTPKARLPSN